MFDEVAQAEHAPCKASDLSLAQDNERKEALAQDIKIEFKV